MQEMMVKLKTSIPEKSQAKVDHDKAIAALISILNQGQEQAAPEQLARVGADAPPLRVATQTRTTDPIDPESIQTSKRIHI